MHVPEGWTEEKLGDLFEFKNGANTEAANYGSGIKFVNVMDIFQNDFLTCERIRESVNLPDNKADLYKLKMGDVLFNRTSETFDEIALSTVYLDTKLAIFGGFVIRGRPKSNRLNHHFCIYCFSTNRVRKELIRRGQGAIRANIGQADIQHVPLLVPPLPEQQKIGQILSTWDKAIEKLEALIAAKQKRKKALMQQLLTGKKRFAGFEGEWKYLKANELFKPVSIKKNGEDELLAVTQDQGVLPRKMLDRKVVMPEGSTEGYKLVVAGNFIISLRSFQGGLEYSNYRGLVSPAYTVLKSIKRISDDFYRHYFKSYDFIGHLAVAVIGIRDGKQISYDDFSFLKLPFPVFEEQQKIAAVLTAADTEIQTHQKQLSALKEQKKGLMQQLLTGKKRVTLDEPALLAAAGA